MPWAHQLSDGIINFIQSDKKYKKVKGINESFHFFNLVIFGDIVSWYHIGNNSI